MTPRPAPESPTTGGKDDCFALPPGVDWTPVDVALASLRDGLAPVAAIEEVALAAADGRILAEDAVARRAHPAVDNAAVDGFAFAHPPGPAAAKEPIALRLREGRAAAGAPWTGRLEAGEAVRIFTGAAMPDGADTVVLQEDVTLDGALARFTPPKKPGANRRRAGENLQIGQPALLGGARLTPQALAQAASAGLDRLRVRARLRVGVLSTGDELTSAAAAMAASAHQVVDANRPMLLALLARLGAAPVDLGLAPDDRGAVEAALDDGAARADVLIASGGASGGDEDHMARALADAAAAARDPKEAAFHVWRIAVKPGRPLAMGRWRGRLVFGLPGNPVAAFVCFLIFVRPALLRLGGAPWVEPRPIPVPLGFDYPKKRGRREYLRVRLGEDGRLEKYRSEGSGLIEGLIWSDGLLDLAHDQGPVAAGAPGAYLPFSALGLGA